MKALLISTAALSILVFFNACSRMNQNIKEVKQKPDKATDRVLNNKTDSIEEFILQLNDDSFRRREESYNSIIEYGDVLIKKYCEYKKAWVATNKNKNDYVLQKMVDAKQNIERMANAIKDKMQGSDLELFMRVSKIRKYFYDKTHLEPFLASVSIAIVKPEIAKISLINPINGKIVLLPGDYRTVRSPTWNCDGTILAYLAYKSENEPESKGLYIYDMRSGEEKHLALYGNNQLAWCPDGTKIAFSQEYVNSESILYVIDSDGKNLTVIDKKYVLYENWLWDRSFTWSSDGAKIAFTSAQPGIFEIFIYDIATKSKKKISESQTMQCGLNWRPNGAEIAFCSSDNRDRRSNYEIYTITEDGTNQVKLTNHDKAYDDTQCTCDGHLNKPKIPKTNGNLTDVSISEVK